MWIWLAEAEMQLGLKQVKMHTFTDIHTEIGENPEHHSTFNCGVVVCGFFCQHRCCILVQSSVGNQSLFDSLIYSDGKLVLGYPVR